MDLKSRIITDIMNRMQGELTNEQCDRLKNTLDIVLYDVKVEQATYEVAQSDGYMESNERILRQYFGTLMIEGKSPKTIERYRLAKEPEVVWLFVLQKLFRKERDIYGAYHSKWR